MRHLDLFSGIGGFALATEKVWPDAEHIFCDNDPFAQAVLKKHWPDSPIHGDIRELRGKDIGTVDLVTGGFPCQPFSAAGKRRGTEDDRHLWPEMLRVIRETAPSWVVGENVSGLLTWDGGVVLEEVFSDLEAEGYEVWAFVIPAIAVNAPHKRDRVWIVAHANSRTSRGAPTKHQDQERKERVQKWDEVRTPGRADQIHDDSNSTSIRFRGRRSKERRVSGRVLVPGESERSTVRSEDEGRDWSDWYETATRLCTLDDGLPGGLVRPKGWRNAGLKVAGNAIVPQVAEQIMRGIKYSDENMPSQNMA